ncbi:MAG: mandelate racemase/muconate lactonizing enzyme family protein [Verrucomicrobia bacterium]|nr:mandelate racemase/muconate lactonizing enzyme family protein [Verrucomicrobiota bacterium]
MKITDIKTVLLTGPSTNDRFILESRKLRSASFIEIHTDTEHVGLGETYVGYFCPESVPSIVEFFKPILIGQNVDDIDELWRRMYHCGNFWCRVGLGTSALTGVEAALWDLRGKLLNKPVFELLGGCRHDRLLCYATGGPSNYPKSRLAEKVDYYLGLGFRAFKVGTGCVQDGQCFETAPGFRSIADFEADKAAFLRKHVGRDVKILMDGHMGNNAVKTWNVETAKTVLKALEPHDLFLFEEPLHYTDPWGYADLARSTSVPVAGGECLTAMYEWRVFAEQESFDIAQPDASFMGGLREFMNVARMFEQRGKKIATHSWGAGGSLLQNIHCGFAAPNTCILEVAADFAGLHKEVMGDSFRMRDGRILPPQTPGLGMVLTDAIKNRYPFVPGSGEFNSVPGKILSS